MFTVGTFMENRAHQRVQIFIVWLPSMRSEFEKSAKSVTASDYFKVEFFFSKMALSPPKATALKTAKLLNL